MATPSASSQLVEAAIPKLQGAANYEEWAKNFENVLRAHGDSYWAIVQGDVQEPPLPKVGLYDDDIIRSIVAREKYIAEHNVSMEDIVTAREQMRQGDLSRLNRWSEEAGTVSDKIVEINYFLLNALESRPYECVHRIPSVPDTWNALEVLYRSCSDQERQRLFGQLNLIKYEGEESRAHFVQRFKEIIAGFRRVVNLDASIECSLFLKSLSGLSAFHSFVAEVESKYSSGCMDMPAVYSRFCCFA